MKLSTIQSVGCSLVTTDVSPALVALLVSAVAKRPDGVGTVRVNLAVVVPGGHTGANSSFYGRRGFKT